MKKILLALAAVTLICASCHNKQTEFARFTEDTYFVGTNFWYGAILASNGQGGDRDRLMRELDALQQLGINNLRILVGADGLPGVNAKVEPTLQLEPGVYNDTILDGLDFLMAELGKRHMYAVLFLNNAWEWSGGYSQYLSWAKNTHWPTPQEVGYPEYMASCAEWARCQDAQQLFYNHVRFIVSRKNRYTGKPYAEDPAIFSWQIGNEPRAFSLDVAEEFADWIHASAKLIKQIDPNHMVSTGSEGIWGCEGDSTLCAKIHAFPEIDYITCHIWPFNWGWLDVNDMEGSFNQAVTNTNDYLMKHLQMANQLGKPVVVEEFGFPRDVPAWQEGKYNVSATAYRDRFYKEFFSWIVDSKKFELPLRGCNFWGWGGEALPLHQQWMPGDPYTGDPAQEDQGLNSVFLTDSTTIAIIQAANQALQ